MRWVFAVVAAFGLVFTVAAYARQGHFWAVGVTAAFAAAAILVATHALAYLLIWCLSELLLAAVNLMRGRAS